MRLLPIAATACVLAPSLGFAPLPATPLRSRRAAPASRRAAVDVDQYVHATFGTAAAAGVDAGPLAAAAATSVLVADGFFGLPNLLAPPSPEEAAVAKDAADAAAAAATDSGGGPMGVLAGPIESAIELVHTGLTGIGIEQSWGLSIILLTLAIKAATYPLTYQQISSTTKMQTLQPMVKDVQSRYQS